jgi:imidazole glycerol phosphate synthase glutamine amidotransferase subunit
VKAGIVDYRMGNLASVAKALEKIGMETVTSDQPNKLEKCDVMVLPGVGNFSAGMENLERLGLSEPIVEWSKTDRPLIGICLGMQLLFEHSEEGETDGLGVLKGDVSRFDVEEKVPHMGWNEIASAKGEPFSEFVGKRFYFVHSYICSFPSNGDRAETDYGGPFLSGIRHGKILGFQFHPEKSGADGLKLLERSIEVIK